MPSHVDIPTNGSVPSDLGEDTLRLVDGRSVAVRSTCPEDAEAIADLFAGLSAESRAMRFGCARGPLTPAEAGAMSRRPDAAGVGLVALAGLEPERAIALARYERASGATEAEIALAVDDRWQGLGVGTGLIERLLALAAAD